MKKYFFVCVVLVLCFSMALQGQVRQKRPTGQLQQIGVTITSVTPEKINISAGGSVRATLKGRYLSNIKSIQVFEGRTPYKFIDVTLGSVSGDTRPVRFKARSNAPVKFGLVIRILDDKGKTVDVPRNKCQISVRKAAGSSRAAPSRTPSPASSAKTPTERALEAAREMKAQGMDAQAVATRLDAMNHSMRDIANALNQIMEAKEQATAAILKRLGASHKTNAEIMKSTYGADSGKCAAILKELGYRAEQIGEVLRDVYRIVGRDAAQALLNLHFPIDAIGKTLTGIYRMPVDQAGKLLKAIGVPIEDIIDVLDQYIKNPEQIAAALKHLAYNPEEIGKALIKVLALNTPLKFIQSLKNMDTSELLELVLASFPLSGFNFVAEILDHMKSVNIHIGGIMKASKEVLDWGWDQVVGQMKSLNFGPVDIAAVLRGDYRKPFDEVADIFKSAGFKAIAIGKISMEVYRNAGDRCAKVLKRLGFPAENVARGLKEGYRKGQKQVARWMKAAGFGKTDIVMALMGPFGLSLEAAKRVVDSIF